jgi:hypothetical protein
LGLGWKTQVTRIHILPSLKGRGEQPDSTETDSVSPLHETSKTDGSGLQKSPSTAVVETVVILFPISTDHGEVSVFPKGLRTQMLRQKIVI